ncbi:hypothetical protein E2C01_003714 [Portunus trituberculatus]|uniref:Uncharacterized protein n=1 Tax=Portunus trituberculatus TaxID=210409 RepID=A0A5B7CQH3_PORTR|nr:hypothetical protein [Portunus trituberculatus]
MLFCPGRPPEDLPRCHVAIICITEIKSASFVGGSDSFGTRVWLAVFMLSPAVPSEAETRESTALKCSERSNFSLMMRKVAWRFVCDSTYIRYANERLICCCGE